MKLLSMYSTRGLAISKFVCKLPMPMETSGMLVGVVDHTVVAHVNAINEGGRGNLVNQDYY